jgi:putative component of membrane protein insertase Oxa1/YidC/SpoIIIJ protein YidD
MRFILIGLISAYQRVAPRALRDRCIFAESCSNFVLRRAREEGVLAAIAALRLRMRRCRPGYFFLPPSSMLDGLNSPVQLADGSIVEMAELSPRLLGT